MTYIYQEFPKWKYHPTLPGKIVQNMEEERALGRAWYNNPGEAKKAVEPSAFVRVLDEKVKPWWTKWQWIVGGCGTVIALISGIAKLWK